MKKVAIFISSLRGGGAERIVSYLLHEGYEKFEIHLILLRYDIEYDIPPGDAIKIVEIGAGKFFRWSSIFKMGTLARELKKYLEDNNIQTMLSLLNRPNLVACRVKKMGWAGKLIISERVDTIAYYKTLRFGWYMIHLVRKYYPYADVVTAISNGISRSLEKLGVHNVRVIYNPIKLTDYPSKERMPAAFTFINVARFEPQKNHALLIRSFAAIKDTNARLILLGKGYLLSELEKLATQEAVRDRVEFPGFHKNINAFLSQADCFVFSSDYEGLGNVIIEALAAGLPVISTDCPYGPREILAPETDTDTLVKNGIDICTYGILTPVGKQEPLVKAMERMMKDGQLRSSYGEKAKARAKDFNIDKIAEEYFSHF